MNAKEMGQSSEVRCFAQIGASGTGQSKIRDAGFKILGHGDVLDEIVGHVARNGSLSNLASASRLTHRAGLAWQTSNCLFRLQKSVNDLRDWRAKRNDQEAREVKPVDLHSGLTALDKIQQLFELMPLPAEQFEENLDELLEERKVSEERLGMIREHIEHIFARTNLLQTCRRKEALSAVQSFRSHLAEDLDHWLEKTRVHFPNPHLDFDKLRERCLLQKSTECFDIGIKDRPFQSMPPLANYFPTLTDLELRIEKPSSLGHLREMNQLRSLNIIADSGSDDDGREISPVTLILPKMLRKINIKTFFSTNLDFSSCLKDLPFLESVCLQDLEYKNLFGHLGYSLITSLSLNGESARIDYSNLITMQNLETLKIVLYSGHQNIASIPANLGAFCPLKTIKFRGINASFLPIWSEDFPILENLEIATGEMTIWPKKMMASKRLKTLNFYQNRLKDGPNFNVATKSLTFIDIRANSFKECPDFVFSQDQITHLFLSSDPIFEISENRFRSFDSRLNHLKNLVTLNAEQCGIEDITTDFAQNLLLENLLLANNSIRTLNSKFSEISIIRILDLSNNQLRELPKEIGNLHHLEKLNVSRNFITSLPDEIAQCQSLLNLNISFNRLTSLPESFFGANLECLSVCQNFYDKMIEKSQLRLSCAELRVFRSAR